MLEDSTDLIRIAISIVGFIAAVMSVRFTVANWSSFQPPRTRVVMVAYTAVMVSSIWRLVEAARQDAPVGPGIGVVALAIVGLLVSLTIPVGSHQRGRL